MSRLDVVATMIITNNSSGEAVLVPMFQLQYRKKIKWKNSSLKKYLEKKIYHVLCNFPRSTNDDFINKTASQYTKTTFM